MLTTRFKPKLRNLAKCYGQLTFPLLPSPPPLPFRVLFIPTRSARLTGGAAVRHGGESTLVGKGLAVAQPPAPRISRHYSSIVVAQLVGMP
jgi:hypothetical protein